MTLCLPATPFSLASDSLTALKDFFGFFLATDIYTWMVLWCIIKYKPCYRTFIYTNDLACYLYEV